ncbi:MAG: hypothetical protein ACT4OS_10390 [Acidimicrobiales bacterium]
MGFGTKYSDRGYKPGPDSWEGPGEDTTGGFRHGGWSFEFFDADVMGAVVDEYAERSEVLLQGTVDVRLCSSNGFGTHRSG